LETIEQLKILVVSFVLREFKKSDASFFDRLSDGVVVVVVLLEGHPSFNVGHLASLRPTTTEAETHNERLCAHTLGDHTVCVLMCACVACVYSSEKILALPL
jgi:hypothetical protein